MSSEVFVRARGLGKRFKLYDNAWGHLAGVAFGAGGGRDHWALRNVDLDLGVGDCVGIVGRNGAGKSTLLELVCGILRPSEGSIETGGRIAALLQLGAGFNPEFTGRENVFLGAALYGLTATQVTDRFADIEAFAGIGDFIDRPVREYSSGMYARLAFSVCAHVDADILVVDEILGVGDVRFQQKSMRFLREFRNRGIVLFVSHNEHAVAALCRSGVWIDGGKVAAAGRTKDVLQRYRREMSRLMGPGGSFQASDAGAMDMATNMTAAAPRPERESAFDPDDAPDPIGGGRIERVELTAAGRPLGAAGGGELVRLKLSCRAAAAMEQPSVLFALRNPMGQIVFAGDSADGATGIVRLDEGKAVDFEFSFRLPFLPTGSYPVELFLLSGPSRRCHDRIDAGAVVRMMSWHISSGLANVGMERTLLLVGPEAA